MNPSSSVSKLTESVIGCAFGVYNQLGFGFLESVYEKSLIVELKSVVQLANSHEIQLVNYLTATGIEDGLLINFGPEKVEVKRKFRTYLKSC